MHLIRHRKNIIGLTLLEMLMALVINVIVLAALIYVFSANVGHFSKATNSDMLNQQLQSALQLMTNEIRRAGYWGNAISDINTGQNNNPFMASGTDITLGANNTCILFSYDNDSNGSIPSITSSSDDERYGFRLSGQTLQARPQGAPFDCTASANAWENMTNTNVIRITNLTFTLNTDSVPAGQATNRILVRSVDISIAGQLATDTSVTKTFTQHVRIRNDKFVP